ncbi:MAG: AAA family ATPase [Candidatus Celaenobacter antarcticus]|nr:AAA family ATPase [Candidatus Celaenobacter antarcticus]
MKKIVLVLLLLFTTNLMANFEENIHHAETYYWLGINDNGDMRSFSNALDYLTKAEKSVSPDSPSSLLKYRLIEALRSDILQQQDMAHDTFYGVFPLTRLLGNTIFVDAASTGTYEFVDDPDVISVTKSAESLYESLINNVRVTPQYGVVINSFPENPALENEVHYIFNSDTKFFVHNDLEISSILSPEQMNDLKENNISDNLLETLFNSISDSHLLLISINEIDVIDGIYFYILEASSFTGDSDIPYHVISNMSFCRDKRVALKPMAWLNLFFLLLAFLIFNLFGSSEKGKILRGQFSIVPLLAFAIGRFLPWILTPFFSTISPPPETLVKLSFWWPFLYGLVVISGTMLIYWLITNRLKKIVPIFKQEGKLGLAFVAVGLGIAAYFSGLMLIYDINSYLSLIPQVISIVMLGYLLGSALDKTHAASVWFVVIAMLFSAFTGMGILIMQPFPLWILAALILISVACMVLTTRRKTKFTTEKIGLDALPDDIPRDAQALAERALQPLYQQFAAFHEAQDIFRKADADTGKTITLAIIGPSGRGKTATANALIESLKASMNDELVILRGECPNEEPHLHPFSPIQQALGSYMGINLSSAMQSHPADIDSMLDEIVDSVIPFSSLMFPSGEGDTIGIDSKQEIYNIIYRTLIKITRKNKVLFFIDDIQWIDDASRELLQYLAERFEQSPDFPIFFLFTSRSDAVMVDLKIEPENTIHLQQLTSEEKISVLHKGLGLTRDLGKQLIQMVGNIRDKRGELFFLLYTIANLAKEGYFIKSPAGFVLSDKDMQINKLPIPEEYSDAVQLQIQKIQTHRFIIGCAACIGLEFNASLLSDCLSIPRLDLLHILDEIEKKTGLIYDVQESDDVYAFQSSFSLEVIRENFQISSKGQGNLSLPQFIHEYHAQIAQTLESYQNSSVFEIARHFYSSGTNYAEKGLQYCIKAAHAASAIFQHDNAHTFLAMAQERAENLGKSAELAEEFLLLEIREAHVENLNQEKVAQKCIVFIKENSNISNDLLIPITRCFYEAGLCTRDQKYFQRAVEIGETIVKSAENDLEKAEAYQLISISLPPSDQDKIVQNLELARNLLLPLVIDNLKTRELLARVENSLAEKLTYGSIENQAFARQLFENSIKTKTELNDKPGLGRSYGGLGRLLMKENNYEEAQKYFEKDLEICCGIQDVGGQVKMYSFIAECNLHREEFDQSLSMYEKSFEMASGLNDRLFAARGYLIVSALKRSEVRVREMGQLLTDHYQEAIGIYPAFFEEIFTAAKNSGVMKDKEWEIIARLYKMHRNKGE